MGPRTYDDGRSETSKSLSFTEITEGGNCEDLAYPDRYIHTIELHFIDGSDGWAEAQVVNMKLFFSDGYDTGNWYGCFSQCYFYTPSQYTQKAGCSQQ